MRGGGTHTSWRRYLTNDSSGGDRLSADELRMLVAGLLMADTDTTRNQLAATVHVLSDHPEQWALLGGHPELAVNAVEGTIRHSPVAFSTLRVALEDVELGGVLIPAGTLVIANTAAANRNPAVYHNPDHLDITRHCDPAIQTFGGGVHSRPGAARRAGYHYAACADGWSESWVQAKTPRRRPSAGRGGSVR